MACGLGAVALMFVFIKESTFTPLNTDFTIEVNNTKNIIKELDIQIDKNLTELDRINSAINTSNDSINKIKSKTEVVNETIKDLTDTNKDLIKALSEIESIVDTKYKPIKKEYISGCNVTGNKIIFLLDTSKSMLDKELINILQMAIMTDSAKNSSRKWVNGKNIMRWLIDNTPDTSEILIAGFNTTLAFDVNEGEWTNIKKRSSIEKQLLNLFSKPPDKGTNLQKTFAGLEPWKSADSIYLITDGLPTQAVTEKNRTNKISRCMANDFVSGDCRVSFFNEFAKEMSLFSSRTKLNTILLPMKGDPEATYYYSYLSTSTGGCFITPSKDWP
tara:strand:+ start:319 stop:1311 length:993 start_codon:yes stop_codon:yes gene_type:complete